MEQSIEVPAEWTSLTRLMTFNDDFEDRTQLSEEQRYLLRLSIEEIATNIIKYGYQDRQTGMIHVTCSFDNGMLRITIRDQGQAFDPQDVPPPDLNADLDSRSVGGLGIFLVRELSDGLFYHHDPVSGWNELVIVKHYEEVKRS